MMNVKRMLSVLVAAHLALLAVGCDEHPRAGQVENERVAEPGEQQSADQEESAGRQGSVGEQGQPSNQSAQAGAEGSELAAKTVPPMSQCIEVVEKVMRCTSSQPFIDAVVSAQGQGMSDEDLTRKAHHWQEPGTRRQSCEELFRTQAQNPFRDAQALNKLVEASGQACEDFAATLEETGALQVISDLESR